jgi:Cys-rich repeat protein
VNGLCDGDPGAEICNGIDDDQDGQIDEEASCGAGQVCKDGACVAGATPCAANGDCPAGQVCQGGQCSSPSLACSSDADCGAGQVCVNGLCDGAPGAEICNGIDDDQDGQVDEEASCSAGQVCKDGQCVLP